MTGGTITFLPPRRPLFHQEIEETKDNPATLATTNQPDQALAPDEVNNEILQLDMQVAWNGSSLMVLEPNLEDTQPITQREESPDQNDYLVITGDEDGATNLPQHLNAEVVVLTGVESGQSEDSNTLQRQDHKQPVRQEDAPEVPNRKRKRPFELELIEQFVRKKGRIGPVTLTLTLKAPQRRKRKAVVIEEIEEHPDTNAKWLNIDTGETIEEPASNTPGPEIAEVTEMLEACFKGFDPIGSKGGLGVWWNKNIDVTIVSASKNWIHLKIKFANNQQIFFTGVYGAPVTSEREALWQYLKNLNIQNEPWILTGDFNQVASIQEKLSKCHNIPGSEDMNNTINNLGLVDLQTMGNWYTWTNGRQGEAVVWERLDKTFANTEWMQNFPDSWVNVLPVIASDHSPLVVQTKRNMERPRRRQFQFEAMWLQHPQLKNIVHSAWNYQGTGLMAIQVQNKIQNVSKHLSRWHKENFGNLTHQISQTHQQVEKLQQSLPYHSGSNEELIARRKLEFLLKCEEIKWAQRAKQLWLVKGNKNTKYFHSMVKFQHMKARINSITLPDGQCVESQEEIKEAAMTYFKQLYKSNAVNGTIIETALFQMNGSKATGPDGMSPMFFQHCWETVHDDVIRMANSFLSRGHILRSMNQTHITLIPKNDAPRGFQDYRPISLCNTTYKIIAKVLTNILQKVMTGVISPFQNAFVKGRLIQDNILIASEILHYIRGSKRTKGGWVALKVDLNKAYDKISWPFLQEVLRYMNSPPPHWQHMVMQCVTTTSLRVKINGELTEWFTPEAGLRQGDPLSLYLYVLCANVLSNYLIKAQDAKSIRGIKISQNAPSINHLMYADDILLFFRADKKNMETARTLLTQFEAMSGLSMSNQKSEIRFSPSVSPQGAQALTKIMNCKQAARTTLIKAVVSATPLYHMQHTWLSHSEAMKCDATIRNFFWGRWHDSKSSIMISWKRLCKNQGDGGMGFREMLKINEALLAKQVWRIVTLEDSLVSKVFLGK
ncbi:ribonuclease H [Senna tora]|uniref:Ribonuclease H n=1 Tax=Senna tora TaxID=362788 RepID=A0A834SGE5_9FABA|nr:ribonuclease H [Senna tora]